LLGSLCRGPCITSALAATGGCAREEEEEEEEEDEEKRSWLEPPVRSATRGRERDGFRRSAVLIKATPLWGELYVFVLLVFDISPLRVSGTLNSLQKSVWKVCLLQTRVLDGGWW
jgi:hypothetical protein